MLELHLLGLITYTLLVLNLNYTQLVLEGSLIEKRIMLIWVGQIINTKPASSRVS